jgi:hypothetical protein
VTTALYFVSEREAPRTVHGTWNGCRVVACYAATCLATGNEAILDNKERHRGPEARVDLILKGLRGADGNWRVDTGFNQGDVDEMQKAMFPGLPLPQFVATDDWDNLVDHLPTEITSGRDKGKYTDGHAISISLELAALPPGDAARRYTAADHQVVLRARRKRGGEWWLMDVDGMHPKAPNYQGHWVKASSVRKAALAILGGVIVAELYPVDGWTQAALQTAATRKDLRGVRAALATETDKVEARNRSIRDLNEEVRILKERLEGRDDCEDEIAAAIADLREKVNVVFDEAA